MSFRAWGAPETTGGTGTAEQFWNASTNTPALVSSTGTEGEAYRVAVAGATLLDGISSWSVNDQAVFLGGVWMRVPAPATVVSSVNTQTGAVVLDLSSLGGFTIAELNAEISDADVDDDADTRPPAVTITANDLVRSDGATLVAASMRETSTQFVFDKSLRAPQTSLFLGDSIQLSSVAERLGVFDLVDSTNLLLIAQAYTSGGGSNLPEYLSFPAAAVISEQTVTADTSAAATTVEFVVNDGAPGLETISDSADFNIASVPAGGVSMRVQIYRSSDDTGPEVADLTIDTPVVGINTVDIQAGLTFLGSTDYFVRISSTATFTLLGDAGPPFVPSYELRGHVVTRQALATQAYANANVNGLTVTGTPADGQVMAFDSGTGNIEWADQATGGDPPSIRDYHTNAPARVDPGTSLTGNDYTATYELDNTATLTSAQLVGFPTATPASRTIVAATASRVDGLNSQLFTFPPGTFFATEGDAYTIQFEAFTAASPSTQVLTASQEIRAQAAGRSDVLYYGVTTASVATNVDVLTLQSQTGSTGTVTMPSSWVSAQRIVFCRPNSDGPYTQIVQVSSGINVLASFPRTQNAFQVGGVDYDVYLADGEDTSQNFGSSQWNLVG